MEYGGRVKTMGRKDEIRVGDHVVLKGEHRDLHDTRLKKMKDGIVTEDFGGTIAIRILDHKHKKCIGMEFLTLKNRLKKINQEHVITVMADGTDTVAIERENGKVIKKAKARLHPDDTYSWETGRDLALNRLLYGTDYHPAEVALKNAETPLRGKAVCVRCDLMCGEIGEKVKTYPLFATGKIYTFYSGFTKAQNGRKYPCTEPLVAKDGIAEDAHTKFLKIVE